MLSNINVSITGGDNAERELMSNVITNALVAEGYSNVALVNTVGEPMVGSNVQSLADVLRKSHPEFLERQVRVWSIPVANGVEMSLDDVQKAASSDTRAFAEYDASMDGATTTVTIAEGKNASAANAAYRLDNEFAEDRGYEYGSSEHREYLENEGVLNGYVDHNGVFDKARK